MIRQHAVLHHWTAPQPAARVMRSTPRAAANPPPAPCAACRGPWDCGSLRSLRATRRSYSPGAGAPDPPRMRLRCAAGQPPRQCIAAAAPRLAHLPSLLRGSHRAADRSLRAALALSRCGPRRLRPALPLCARSARSVRGSSPLSLSLAHPGLPQVAFYARSACLFSPFQLAPRSAHSYPVFRSDSARGPLSGWGGRELNATPTPPPTVPSPSRDRSIHCLLLQGAHSYTGRSEAPRYNSRRAKQEPPPWLKHSSEQS